MKDLATGMTESEDPKRGAFPRAWQVLEFVAGQAEPPSAQHIAQSLRLALPTAMRLLTMLVNEGLVEPDGDSRLYLPGPALFRLMALGAQSGTLASLTRSPLRELAQTTGETACLNLLQPNERFSVVAVEEGRQQLRYVVELGGLHPLTRGAGGKAILAFLDPPLRDRVAENAGLPDLMSQIERIHEEGFALSFGERVPGAVGFAAPIFGLDGAVRGSVQITLPEHRYRKDFEQAIRGPLTAAARALSASVTRGGVAQ
jgi:DNA-binding IclR family transcriptional regulator